MVVQITLRTLHRSRNLRPGCLTPALVNMYGVIKKCVYAIIHSIVHNCCMEKIAKNCVKM